MTISPVCKFGLD